MKPFELYNRLCITRRDVDGLPERPRFTSDQDWIDNASDRQRLELVEACEGILRGGMAVGMKLACITYLADMARKGAVAP